MHDLQDNGDKLLNIMDECKKSGNENMPVIFYSTSKITFPGAGVAFMACSGDTLGAMKKMYSVKTVGFDKINQLRHLRFLKDKATLFSHMKKHREILKPKFELILNMLEKEFGDNPIIAWERPHGGYFISVQTYKNCAKRVVELCKNAGVVLTKAGATYPYGSDPSDSNIRLAPTYPTQDELDLAMKLFCLCVKIAFIEQKIS